VRLDSVRQASPPTEWRCVGYEENVHIVFVRDDVGCDCSHCARLQGLCVYRHGASTFQPWKVLRLPRGVSLVLLISPSKISILQSFQASLDRHDVAKQARRYAISGQQARPQSCSLVGRFNMRYGTSHDMEVFEASCMVSSWMIRMRCKGQRPSNSARQRGKPSPTSPSAGCRCCCTHRTRRRI